jgi:serine/threonine protein kinase
MSLSSGTFFAQYRIGRKIGSGGMGDVYQATHLILGREVALKTVRPDAVHGNSQGIFLIQEARAASALDHPNIVKVYDVGDVEGTVYIAMEYVEGQTLRQILGQRALRPKEALQYAVQIANALGAAHDVGMLHRDVKPANIIITRKGMVKMVDFGLAKQFSQPEPGSQGDLSTISMDKAPTLGVNRRVSGTVGYMSPEQIRGSRIDARSDIFSFGIVLYEMFTGVRPFAAPSAMAITANILHAEPRPVREIAPYLPEELDDVVQFCLCKDPDDRARSMHDIAHILKATQHATEWRSAISTSTNKRGYWILSGGALILALLAGWWGGTFLASGGRRAQPPRAVLRRITWDGGLSESAALSNDGRLLAFASDRAGGKNLNIFLRHMSGGEPIRLTNNPAGDTDPSFSPDGGMIAFRSERNGGGIYIMPSF